MLSYSHRYHAGNFADLHKHMALLAILLHFYKKTTPFCVLDAYAGEGLYDLNSAEIQRNKEYLQGYEKYEKYEKIQKEGMPLNLMQNLITVAQECQNKHNIASVYPGSPAIIAHYLRAQDRAIFTELHPQAYLELNTNLSHTLYPHKNIHIYKQDGLAAINAFLPFKEGRGLVFIDPSYEVKTEYLSVATSIKKNYSKFSQGIYVIWYPILTAGYHHALITSILELKQQKIKPTFWESQWIPNPQLNQGLIGSGLLVINPPWQFSEMMSPLPSRNI